MCTRCRRPLAAVAGAEENPDLTKDDRNGRTEAAEPQAQEARARTHYKAVRPRCSPARAAATANSPSRLPDVRVLQRRQRVTVED